MYILLADETNVNPDKTDFFVYGALYFEHDKLPEIHERLECIRERHNFQPADRLKWNHYSRPKHISRQTHSAAKSEVIDVAEDVGAQFIPVIVPHGVKAERSDAEVFKWSVRDALGQFHYFLDNEDAYAICAVDPLPDGVRQDVLESVFHTGLQFPQYPNRDALRLDRIKMIATVTANASHASSLMDIVLGAFKYCINNPGYEVCEGMFYQVASMIRRFNSDGFDFKYGVLIRPKGIRSGYGKYTYQARQLVRDMNDLLKRSKQSESDERKDEDVSDVDDVLSSDDDMPF